MRLSGFAFHLDRNGFRLPTEAEWTKAAAKNFDPAKSFNSSNSGYKAHTVCELEKDSTAFCDFSGNLLEWVNDFMGSFSGTIVSNFAGASSQNSIGERIVKGGNFRLDTASIHLYSRGDVYTVTVSSSADYVGFRLAKGAISNPTFLDESGKIANSPIQVLATAADILPYTGMTEAKLVFRNDLTENLAFIDYNVEPLSVTEIQDTLSVYHPDISPDGKYVAFCTGIEGIPGKSNVYVRRLDSIGSGLVKLDVESAAIPRFSVLDGDTVIIYVTDAGNNKESSTFSSQSTWEVPFANGQFGTPTKLFDGAYHDGISADIRLAVTGSKLLRAKIAGEGETLLNGGTDTIWYNGEQACNATLARDGSKQTAFLDFGSKTGRDFVGKSYAAHEYLLIVDSTGILQKALPAPSGYAFDHTEWAGEKSLVGTLTNSDGAHSKIILLSAKDSSYLSLAESDELWHPVLWTKSSPATTPDTLISSILDPDSAGQYYNSSGACPKAMDFRYKMELLWKYRDSANLVIFGSSRAYHGINPALFKKPAFGLNFATPANIISGSYAEFENYVLPHVKNLKAIIVAIDLDRGYNDGKNRNNMFYKAYKSYPGYVYDKNHGYWQDSVPKDLDLLTENSPGDNSYQKVRTHFGYRYLGSNSWGTPSIGEDSVWSDSDWSNYRQNFNLFTNMLQICQERNIAVIGVLIPLNPAYKETGAYGYRGLQRSKAVELIEELSALQKAYPNFYLMDENKMGDHDYTDEMACDHSHLSDAGATQLSKRLDSLITSMGIFEEK